MSEVRFDPDQVMERLLSIAKSDGVVSDDENNLLKVVEAEMKKYSGLLTKASEDGVIDRGEKLQLFNQRLSVVRKVFDTVQKDMKITRDEQSLLDTLMTQLNELHEFEDN